MLQQTAFLHGCVPHVLLVSSNMADFHSLSVQTDGGAIAYFITRRLEERSIKAEALFVWPMYFAIFYNAMWTVTLSRLFLQTIICLADVFCYIL